MRSKFQKSFGKGTTNVPRNWYNSNYGGRHGLLAYYPVHLVNVHFNHYLGIGQMLKNVKEILYF